MGLNSKRRKFLEEDRERPSEEDRISSLPNSIISDILSLLPTKDAVATSVLSTRWKEYWKSITSLYFDDNMLLSTQNKKTARRLHSQFIGFVYRVLLLRRFSSIDKFHLHCSRTLDYTAVNTWLSSALKSNLQELDFSVPFMDRLLLPSKLFTSTTLVKLKLDGEVFMRVPDSVCLPCVKVVDLTLVKFLDDDSITRFLRGCPVLDTLKMRTCVVRSVKVIKVSVPTLRSLSLQGLRHEEEDVVQDNTIGAFTLSVVLETPMLEQFFISDYAPEGYVLENLHHLTVACILITYPLGRDTKSNVPFQDIHRVAVNDLLKGVSEVKELFLFTQGMSSLQLPTFKNLTDLTFDVLRHVPLELLHTSPQLRCLKLTFDHEDECIDAEANDGTLEVNPSEGVPNCCMFHLKIIEIVNFRASNKEMELVEYILKNALVLEKLTIRCRSQKSLKASELLMTLPRASRGCQVEFSIVAVTLCQVPSFSVS